MKKEAYGFHHSKLLRVAERRCEANHAAAKHNKRKLKLIVVEIFKQQYAHYGMAAEPAARPVNADLLVARRRRYYFEMRK